MASALLLLLVLGLGAEGINLEKETKTGDENVRGGEKTREGKTRDVSRLLERRCKWSVGGIDRYVVEGEVMEEGGNRWECLQGRMTILGESGNVWPRNRFGGTYGKGYGTGVGNRYRGTYDKGYGTGLGSRFRGGWRKGDWRNDVGLGVSDWRRRRSCTYYVGGRRVEVASGEDVSVKGQLKTCINGRLTDSVGLSRGLGYQPRYGGIGKGYRGYNRGYNANRGLNNVFSKDFNGYDRYNDYGGIFDDFDYERQQACGGCRWKGRVYCSGDVIEDLPSWKFETRCIEGKAKVVARQWGEVAKNLRIP